MLIAMGRAAWAIDVDARPAAAWFEDALRIFREVDEPVGIGWMLGLLAEEQLGPEIWRGGESGRRGDRSRHQVGAAPGLAESRRMLAMRGATGEHADAERLLEEAAAAHEQGDDLAQLAMILTAAARLAFVCGDDAQALRPLRQALRLARDSASGEHMSSPSSGRVCPPPPRACT